MITDVVVCDGGSVDGTLEIAEKAGARVVHSDPGRGRQLSAGAAAGTSSWLLFLHADTRLGQGWEDEVSPFMTAKGRDAVAVFSFALDDSSRSARVLEWLVKWRCRIARLPYGDQGLLISRKLYDDIGGYRALPLMEDVDIVRRIGSRRLVFLSTPAVTSAARYRREGYLRRGARNLCCLALYFLGVPPHVLVRLYR